MVPPERALFFTLGAGLAVELGSAAYIYPPGALAGIVVVFASFAGLFYGQVRSLTGPRTPRRPAATPAPRTPGSSKA